MALLIDLQYYQRCETMILKMWVKSKFVLWQSLYYNLLTEKNDEQILIFEVFIFFEKVMLLSISINYLQTPSLNDIILVNFPLSNSIILVEDRVR